MAGAADLELCRGQRLGLFGGQGRRGSLQEKTLSTCPATKRDSYSGSWRIRSWTSGWTPVRRRTGGHETTRDADHGAGGRQWTGSNCRTSGVDFGFSIRQPFWVMSKGYRGHCAMCSISTYIRARCGRTITDSQQLLYEVVFSPRRSGRWAPPTSVTSTTPPGTDRRPHPGLRLVPDGHGDQSDSP
jgi:hypothetical protein